MIDKNKMFLENEKLIYFVLKKHFSHLYYNIDMREEYYQVGSIGLLKAINYFDKNAGTSFSTYAVPMIWGEIKKTLRDNNSVHYSRKIMDIANKLSSEYYDSGIDKDYEEYLNEKLSSLDISNHEKIGVKNYYLDTISLNQSINYKDEEITLESTLIDVNNNVENDILFNDYVTNILNRLKNERDKQIAKLLLNNETQSTIAYKMNLSQAQVSRIFTKVKMFTITELFESRSYDSALNKLCELEKTNEFDVERIYKNYDINLLECPKDILEKRNITMNDINQKIYSKKSCQKLILKAAMKQVLSHSLDETNDINVLKENIKTVLKKNNLKNISLFKHLDLLTKSQLLSCITLAKKTIEKYNYNKSYQIIIDESDFRNMLNAKILTNRFNTPLDKTKKLNTQTVCNDNKVMSIINLLERLKEDNLAVRFQL